MKYPFTAPALPYAYNALEPYIDEATMHFHHDKHLQAYVDNLNAAVKDYPELHNLTLEELLSDLRALPEKARTAIRNNGGGVYNHIAYFSSMTPNKKEIPEKISAAFGGKEAFLSAFKKAALGQFGSGFAWLVETKEKELRIIALPNQDNPLSQDLIPLLPLDVWEHAYYLKYQNRRGAYIDEWLKIVDWDVVMKKMK